MFAVFGSAALLPLLIAGDGGLVCELLLLSDHFDMPLLICRYLAIRLLVLPPLCSGRVRSGISC